MTNETELMPAALLYFKPPFKYENLGQTVYCEGANGKQMCLQVRGWGNLIGGGAKALHHDEAAKIQDEFGQWVANTLNTCADAQRAPVDLDALKKHKPCGESIVEYRGSDTEIYDTGWNNCIDYLHQRGFIAAAPKHNTPPTPLNEAHLGGLNKQDDPPDAVKMVDYLDPDMPAAEILLHMGELTENEILVARAAIRWANSKMGEKK